MEESARLGVCVIDNAGFLVAINLAVAALFAGAFLCIAAVDRTRSAPNWFAVGFVAAVLYFLIEFARDSFGTSAFLMIAMFEAFLLTLVFVNVGLAKHYRAPVPTMAIAVVTVVGGAMIVLSQLLPGISLLHLYLYQTPYALMQAIGAWLVFRHSSRRPLDWLLVCAMLASAAHFVAKPLIGAATDRLSGTDLRYFETSYALYSQSLGAVLGTGIALLLIVILMKDMLLDMAMRARTDSLTGLLNRGAFYERLGARLGSGTHSPATLVICDLDRFKSINDTYGHACGDAVLVHFARILNDVFGDEADIGRIGGEEFAVLLPVAPPQDVHALAESVRARFYEDGARTLRLDVALSASFGLVALRDLETADKAFARADMLMYRAKAMGRNRLCIDTGQGDNLGDDDETRVSSPNFPFRAAERVRHTVMIGPISG